MGDNLKQLRLLGEGAFGKCYLCENSKDNSLWVVKQIDMSRMTPQEKREAYHEAKVMSAFDHPNIIKFKEVYTTTNGKLNIVMSYADGGDLQSKIKSQRGRLFNENEILDMFMQICLAIKHVHDRKVLHRDIKGQNIFLMKNGMIKLGDFGISKVLTSTMDKARTMVGTPYYLSPEIVEGKPYNFKSDVWSLGVLLYELCTLKPPFDGNSIRQLGINICRGTYPPLPGHFSKELKNLVTIQLALDPNKRPTVGQMLKLPFITSRIHNVLTESVRFQEFSHTIFHNQDLFALQKQQGDAKAKEDELARKKAEEEKKRCEAKEEMDRKRENDQKRILREAEIRLKEEENRKREEENRKREEENRKREEEARKREEEARKRELENKKKQEMIREIPRQIFPHKRDGSKDKLIEVPRPKFLEIPSFKPVEERKGSETPGNRLYEDKKAYELPQFKPKDDRRIYEIPVYKPPEDKRANEIFQFKPQEERKNNEIPAYKPNNERKGIEIPQFKQLDDKAKVNEISQFKLPEERGKNIEVPRMQQKIVEDRRAPVVYKPPSPVVKYNPSLYQKSEDLIIDTKPKNEIIKDPPVKQEKDFKAKYEDLLRQREKEELASKKRLEDFQRQKDLNAKKFEDDMKKISKDIISSQNNDQKLIVNKPNHPTNEIPCIIKPENIEQEQLIKVLKEAVESSSEDDSIILEMPTEEEDEDGIVEREDNIGTEELLILDREKPELEDMKFFIEDHLGKDETFKAYQILKSLGDVFLDEKTIEANWHKFQDFLKKSQANEYLPLIQTLIFLEAYV
ncbi:hypothetical protein SteCoe_27269 [Stentor coeruleus]|uniref:non-specific serine/threonine protein kinase n=1 Tax=Stentor coeruleus TaxID=5963 RepID=A0A1R2BAZ5_9CILI|nr:hypothetical protein SteCoe_27269 [Stentor coeruleus]